MKVVVNAKDWNLAVKAAAVAMDKKGRNVILGGLELRADGGALHVRCFDLDLDASVSIPATVIEAGSAVLDNAKNILKLTAKSKGNLTITAGEENGIGTIEGEGRMTVRVLPAKNYPCEREGDKVATMLISKEAFAKVMPLVMMAADGEAAASGRWFGKLQTVSFVQDEGVLRLCSTDSCRLALNAIPARIQGKIPTNTLVPTRLLKEVLKAVKGAGLDEILIWLAGSCVFASINNGEIAYTYSCRLIEGEFPDYARILGHTPVGTLSLPVYGYKKSVNEVANAISNKYVAIYHKVEDGILKLHAEDKEAGIEIDKEAFIAGIEGEFPEVGMRTAYLKDFLALLNDEDEITIDCAGKYSPVFFKIKGNDTYQYLVMPVA